MTMLFEVLVKDELRSGRVDRWTQGEGMEAVDRPQSRRQCCADIGSKEFHMSAIPSLNGSLHGIGAQDPRVTGRAANPRLNLEGQIDPTTKADSVELSSEAIEQSLKFEAPSRADLIARVKAQIADGSYNEDDKLTVVADQIASELNGK